MDFLGNRMKGYEEATSLQVPSNSWVVIRLDGKAFHTYTRGLRKPFDFALMSDMYSTMKFLCEKIDSTVFAYTQSDEISLILTDTQSEKTQLWFGGKVQKMVSVSAGYAAAYFNSRRPQPFDLAVFDARAFTLPSQAEVVNYLRWRQMDCQRNALFLAASEYYSHKELHGKGRDEKISMLEQAGSPWEIYPDSFKLGIQCRKVYKSETVSYTRKDTGATDQTNVLRAHWEVTPSTEYQGVQLCELLSSEPQLQSTLTP